MSAMRPAADRQCVLRLGACLLLLATSPLLVPTVEATSYTWTGGAGDVLWSTAANWSPVGVPSNSDDQATVSGGSVTLSPSTEIQRLTTNGDVQLQSLSDAILRLDELFIIIGSLVTYRSNITVVSAFQLSARIGISIDGGVFTLGPSCVASIAHSGSEQVRILAFDEATLIVEGTLHLTGPVTFAVIKLSEVKKEGVILFSNTSVVSFDSSEAQLQVRAPFAWSEWGKVTFDSLSRFEVSDGVVVNSQPILVTGATTLQLNSGFRLLDPGLVVAFDSGQLLVADDVQIASVVVNGAGAPAPCITGLNTSSIDPTSGAVTTAYPKLQVQSLLINNSGSSTIQNVILSVVDTFSVENPNNLLINKARLILDIGSSTTFMQVDSGATQPMQFAGSGRFSAVTFAGAVSVNVQGALLLHQLSATFTNTSVTTFASSSAQLTMLGAAVTFDTLASVQLAPGVAATQSPRIVTIALSGAGSLRLNSGFQLAGDITLGMHSTLLVGSNVKLSKVFITPARAATITGGSLAIDHLAVNASAAISGALTLTLNSVEAVIRSSFNITSVNGVSTASVNVRLLSGSHLTLANTSSADIRSTGPGISPSVMISADATSRLSMLGSLTYSAQLSPLTLSDARVDFPTVAISSQLSATGTGPIVLSSPSIASCWPAQGLPNTALTMTLTGTGFTHPGSLIVQYGPTFGAKRSCVTVVVVDDNALTCSIDTDVMEVITFRLLYTDTYNTPSSQLTVPGGRFDGTPIPVDYTWTGGGGDFKWSTSSNWSPAGVPRYVVDQATITVASGVITLPSSVAIQRLTLAVLANPLELTSVGATTFLVEQFSVSYVGSNAAAFTIGRMNVTVVSSFHASAAGTSGTLILSGGSLVIGPSCLATGQGIRIHGDDDATVTIAGSLQINSFTFDCDVTFTNTSATIVFSAAFYRSATFHSLSRFESAGSSNLLYIYGGTMTFHSGFQQLSFVWVFIDGADLRVGSGVQLYFLVLTPLGVGATSVDTITGLTASSDLQVIGASVTRANVRLINVVLRVHHIFTLDQNGVTAQFNLTSSQLLLSSTCQATLGIATPPISCTGDSTSSIEFAGATEIKGVVLFDVLTFFANSSITTLSTSRSQFHVSSNKVTFDTSSQFHLTAGIISEQPPLLLSSGTLQLNSGFRLIDPALTLTQQGGTLLVGSNVELASVIVAPSPSAAITGGPLTIDQLAVDASAAVTGVSLSLALNSVDLVIRSSFTIASVNDATPGQVSVKLLSGAHLTLANTSSVDIRSTGTGTSPNVTISADSTSRLSLLSPLTYSADVGRLQLHGSRLDFLPPNSNQLRQAGTGPIVLSPPSITSNSPKRGYTGTALTVTITGVGFVHPGSLVVQYGSSKRECANLNVLNGTTLACSIVSNFNDEVVTFALVYTDTYNIPSSQVTTTGGSFTGYNSWCTLQSVANGEPSTCGTKVALDQVCSIACDSGYTLAGDTSLQCVEGHFTGAQSCTLDNPVSKSKGSTTLIGTLSQAASGVVIAFICIFVVLLGVCITWRCRRQPKEELDLEVNEIEGADVFPVDPRRAEAEHPQVAFSPQVQLATVARWQALAGMS